MEAAPTTAATTTPHAHSFPPPAPARPSDDTPPHASEPTAPELTDALAVRVGLGRRLLLSVTELGGPRQRGLVFKGALALSQLVTFAAIAGIASSDSCDQPLRIYLILSAIRIGVTFPLSFYSALVPERRRSDTAEQIAQREARRRFGSPLMDRRVRQITDLCHLTSLVLFILANWWFFSSSTCRTSSPRLYFTTLAGLIISWLSVLEVVLIVLGLLFFLPLVIVLMRVFGVGEKTNEIGPLTNADIAKLPLRVFRPPAGTATITTDESVEPATSSSGSPRSRLWRLLRARSNGTKAKVDDASPTYDRLPRGVSFIELEDHRATCAVCLMDYDPPPESGSSEPVQLLRLLPCSHTFHRDCLDSWLVVSGRCPVCQQPVLPGKRGTPASSGDAAAGSV